MPLPQPVPNRNNPFAHGKQSLNDAPMLNRSKRSPAQAATYATLLTLVQSLPWLIFLLSGSSLIAVANESIAYRYFHSFRLVKGEIGTIWEAQGQSLGLLHVGFQYLLDALGVESLRLRIDLFSYGTLAANSLAFGLLSYGLARKTALDRARLAIVSAVTIFGIYGSIWGLMSARLPDYYTFEVTLTVASLSWALLRWSGAAVQNERTEALMMGALGGLMAGIKITLVPTALLPLLAFVLTQKRTIRNCAALIACWSLAAGGSLALTVLLYYHFDLNHLLRAFEQWRIFVAAPGAEPNFVDNLRATLWAKSENGTDLRFIWVVMIFWLTASIRFVVSQGRRGEFATRSSLLGAGLLLWSMLHVYAIAKRPAETTLFESGLFLVTASVFVTLIHGTADVRQRRWVFASAGILLLWSGVSGAAHFPGPALLQRFKASGEAAWEIHETINESQLPVTVLLPDNNATSGTLEDALLKGFSDVPTWLITSGYDLFQRVAPGRHYVQQLDLPPAGHLLMWAEAPYEPSLPERNPAIARIIAQPGTVSKSWTLERKKGWVRTVNLVCPGQVGDEPLPSVIRSEDRWINVTAEDPLAGFSISPAEAQPKLEVVREGDRVFVRVTATRTSAYIALTGIIPALPNESGPYIVRSRARTNRARPVVIQIYDVVDEAGSAERRIESVTFPAHRWESLAVRKSSIRHPHASDNFSVGLLNVEAGDLIEVEFLELRGPTP